jgi:hypothetical protein
MTDFTPSSFSKGGSMHQKQPPAKVAWALDPSDMSGASSVSAWELSTADNARAVSMVARSVELNSFLIVVTSVKAVPVMFQHSLPCDWYENLPEL